MRLEGAINARQLQCGGPGSGRKPGSAWTPPFSIRHDNRNWHHTGKVGTHAKSGEPSAEYEHVNDQTGDRTGERVWMRQSGKVEPE